MRTITCAIALSLSFGVASVAAADFDGSKVMICAPTTTLICGAIGTCVRGEAGDVNLDHFIEIDVANKSARGITSGRISPIGHVARDGGQLVLHGAQNSRGWSATISESSGEMTIAVAAEKLSFTVFGACMATE